ncbi:hypothetical protein EGM88_00140 [Aureibaculum marinum]|uniref:Uncharacterized protein n=1 Tax=Aureibaculum marinum TaxID=2487930 RepID=A0A3N4NY13_9FLAO|nr:hypothetical protein [Aureibaculum marinum]RPE00796.1 hypothetical protein EGM88_00140 [Aureibaculum marinum]
MNKLLFITNALMAIVLSRFAISKLTGWEISVKAFIEMAKPLGIDPTFFRIATGILISVVVIGYLATAIFSLVKNNAITKFNIPFSEWAFYANLLGLLTMVGALIAEYTLRIEPKMLLVYIALGIVLLSSLNIFILNRKQKVIINKL